MIITLQLDPASDAAIRARPDWLQANWPTAMAVGLMAAVTAGANSVAEQLQRGELGITAQHGTAGLAGSVSGWMISADPPIAALGVPSNSPAARYAGVHEHGGVITPVKGKALAIPISAEAKRYTSPRDMEGLTLMPRQGRPPLLVRELGWKEGIKKRYRVEVHWVLVPSVTIRATHWLSRGAASAIDVMQTAFERAVNRLIKAWK